MRANKEKSKVKPGGCRDQNTYNEQWSISKASWYRRLALQKEQEMLATTSLKDLIK
jgi:hypothetical protein